MLSRGCVPRRREQTHKPCREGAYGDTVCRSTVKYGTSHSSPCGNAETQTGWICVHCARVPQSGHFLKGP